MKRTTTAAQWATIKAAEYEAMTDTARTIADTYRQYEQDVSAVLANLDRTSPAPLIRQLQNARRADQTARANPATAESIDEAEAAHAEAREAITEADRISHRITAAEADRIAAAQEAADMRAEADEARTTAADLAKVVSRTLSDRADLVQVAAAADLEEPTAAELEAAERTAEERGEELTAEEIHANAKRRHRRNAVSRYVRAQRGGNALNGMHTDTRPATPEEVAAWMASGKATGADNKQPTKSGYITLEHREQTKSRPAGWYFISRRYTVNQWTSIEALTEDGATAGYIRTQSQYAADLDALERIEALAAAAELTARERDFLAVFSGRAARQAGAESRRAYHTEAGKKATEAGANAAEYAARKAYTFDRIGINTDTNRRQFFSRLTRRLAAAAKVEHTCTTPAEFAEHDRRFWEVMQRDSRRGTARETARRLDLVASMSRAAAEILTPAAVIRWTETEYTAEPTSGKDYRAAEVERRTAENAAHAARTADHAAELTAAKMTARAAAEAHAAAWNARPPHTMTAAEFNAIPAAARLATLDRIHAEGKRLEIVKG
jgi:hypothetical protein